MWRENSQYLQWVAYKFGPVFVPASECETKEFGECTVGGGVFCVGFVLVGGLFFFYILSILEETT